MRKISIWTAVTVVFVLVVCSIIVCFHTRYVLTHEVASSIDTHKELNERLQKIEKTQQDQTARVSTLASVIDPLTNEKLQKERAQRAKDAGIMERFNSKGILSITAVKSHFTATIPFELFEDVNNGYKLPPRYEVASREVSLGEAHAYELGELTIGSKIKVLYLNEGTVVFSDQKPLSIHDKNLISQHYEEMINEYEATEENNDENYRKMFGNCQQKTIESPYTIQAYYCWGSGEYIPVGHSVYITTPSGKHWLITTEDLTETEEMGFYKFISSLREQ